MDQDRAGDYPRPTLTKYPCVTLDRTLGYFQHIHNTKMKAATRNNLLFKQQHWHYATLWQNTQQQSGRDNPMRRH